MSERKPYGKPYKVWQFYVEGEHDLFINDWTISNTTPASYAYHMEQVRKRAKRRERLKVAGLVLFVLAFMAAPLVAFLVIAR